MICYSAEGSVEGLGSVCVCMHVCILGRCVRAASGPESIVPAVEAGGQRLGVKVEECSTGERCMHARQQ